MEEGKKMEVPFDDAPVLILRSVGSGYTNDHVEDEDEMGAAGVKEKAELNVRDPKDCEEEGEKMEIPF